MTELKRPELTQEEQAHIAKGGRVFIVEEIPGQLWRALDFKRDTCRIMITPDGMDGYCSREDALSTALMIANLSEDSPLVRC